MTTIREATTGDLPVVDQMAHDAIGSPQPQGRHLADPDSKRVLLVAETEGQVVGMISVGPPRSDLRAYDERGGRMDFSKAPWWKIYALATNTPRTGVGSALLREVQRRLPRRMRGLYGNVATTREHAIAFYRSTGFYLAPSLDLEGPEGRTVGMTETPGELYFVAPRQRLFQDPDRWERHHADKLMQREIKVGSKVGQRSDVGYRTWLRSFTAPDAACGHDRLGLRPLFTFAYDPAQRTWCTRCKSKAVHVIATHPDIVEDETLCDGCGRRDLTTQDGWAYDESRLLIGYAYLCSTCRTT